MCRESLAQSVGLWSRRDAPLRFVVGYFYRCVGFFWLVVGFF
jgi:hypothetical protein